MLYAFIHKKTQELLRLGDVVADEDLSDLVAVGTEAALETLKRDVLDEVGGFEDYKLTCVSTRH